MACQANQTLPRTPTGPPGRPRPGLQLPPHATRTRGDGRSKHDEERLVTLPLDHRNSDSRHNAAPRSPHSPRCSRSPCSPHCSPCSRRMPRTRPPPRTQRTHALAPLPPPATVLTPLSSPSTAAQRANDCSRGLGGPRALRMGTALTAVAPRAPPRTPPARAPRAPPRPAHTRKPLRCFPGPSRPSLHLAPATHAPRAPPRLFALRSLDPTHSHAQLPM